MGSEVGAAASTKLLTKVEEFAQATHKRLRRAGGRRTRAVQEAITHISVGYCRPKLPGDVGKENAVAPNPNERRGRREVARDVVQIGGTHTHTTPRPMRRGSFRQLGEEGAGAGQHDALVGKALGRRSSAVMSRRPTTQKVTSQCHEHHQNSRIKQHHHCRRHHREL